MHLLGNREKTTATLAQTGDQLSKRLSSDLLSSKEAILFVFLKGKKKEKKFGEALWGKKVLELGFLTDFQKDKNMTNFHHLEMQPMVNIPQGNGGGRKTGE